MTIVEIIFIDLNGEEQETIMIQMKDGAGPGDAARHIAECVKDKEGMAFKGTDGSWTVVNPSQVKRVHVKTINEEEES